MKILYISQSSHLYGSGKALYNIIVGMHQKQGVRVFVVLPNDEGALYKALLQIGIAPIIIPIPSSVYPTLGTQRDRVAFFYRLFRIIRHSKKAYYALKKVVKDINPNIIHTNVGVIHTGYSVAKRMKIPHVWHIREFQDLHFGWTPIPSNQSFKKKLHSEGNYCVSISKALYQHYELGLNASVIYDGVFDEMNIPKITNSKQNYFLYVGNISEGKGVREAVNGFKTFSKNNPGYEFWLAGEGAMMPWLKEQANEMPAIKALNYRNDINQLMQGAIALIVPSRFEGFGFILVEAMLNHCIVIGHDIIRAVVVRNAQPEDCIVRPLLIFGPLRI